MGVSRSVSFVVAYIMSITNLDYVGAYSYVSSKRRNAFPNFGFRMQLRKFYDKVIFYNLTCIEIKHYLF